MSQSSALEIMPSPKLHRKVGTKKGQMAHGTILIGSLHKSQLEAHEAVTSKADLKSISEAYLVKRRNPNANGHLQIVVQNHRTQRP